MNCKINKILNIKILIYPDTTRNKDFSQTKKNIMAKKFTFMFLPES